LVKGEKREKHLCEECAGQEGVAVKQHVSINDVLNSFLMQHQRVQELSRLKCSECTMTFAEFRSQGALGCPTCYDTFGAELEHVIERAQDGKTHHTGRRPDDVRSSDPLQLERLRLQRALRDAVEREDYESAARIRDQMTDKKSS
jgi:protein arginine kinase activator